ncbi:MAG: serine/threonine-protein kinase [Planctomycetota bacterium]|nr:serine/threonine-protein kinase [Planctomycetota bacterium]
MTGLFSDSFQSFETPEIEDYEVLSVLGQGGHSTVYLARGKSGQEVAIKRWLNPDLGQSHRMRIEREVKALTQLDHPHIVQFIELVQDQTSRPCIVMEYIKGESLAALLERGSLDLDQAIGVALTLTEALSFLEDKQLIHRDIKPSNVVLREGTSAPVLVDFSIVKNYREQKEDSAALTKTGTSIGTAPYMAPEQCEGELDRKISVDQRTDIYGLGALLFHCLIGHPPWTRESAWERLTRNPWDNPYPGQKSLCKEIQEQQNRIPKGLAKVVRRCLQGYPEQRYKNAGKLRKALLRCKAPPRKQRLLLSLSFACLAGVVILGLFFIEKNIRKIDQARKQNPNNLQNDNTNDLKDSKMIKSLAVTIAPLMIIAAGSEGEAQYYDKTIQTRCVKCSKVYPEVTDICPEDKAETKPFVIRTVKDVREYFPVEVGMKWTYKLSFAIDPRNKNQEDQKLKGNLNAMSALLGSLKVLVNKESTVDLNSQTIFELASSHSIGKLKPTLSYLGVKDNGFMVLSKTRENKVIPFPLRYRQSWLWIRNSAPLLDAIFDRSVAEMTGFTMLKLGEKALPCLTIQIDQSKKKSGVIRLYFAKHIGLVKTVHTVKGVGSRVTELTNVKDFHSVQAEKKIEAIAKQWLGDFFLGQSSEVVKLSAEPFFIGTYRHDQSIDGGQRQLKKIKYLSAKELSKHTREKWGSGKYGKLQKEMFQLYKLVFIKQSGLMKLAPESALFKNHKEGLYRASFGVEGKKAALEVYLRQDGKVVGVLEND